MTDDAREPHAHDAFRGARAHVVVVGGGISGLTAAFALAGDPRVRVSVVEGSPRTGGKLRRGEVAGLSTDLGAEALLVRRPEAVQLITELGLGGDLVHPVTTRAAVWSRGALRPLPAKHVMGVPTSLRALAASGVVSPLAVARAALDDVLPASCLDADVSVASFVGRRLGRAVVDRLVEPLLGGVYAGRADELSLRATLPQVATVAAHRPLMKALSAPGRPVAEGPVFAGLPGGVGRLAEVLTDTVVARGVDIIRGEPARSLDRTPAGWRVVLGSAAAARPRTVDADAVVVAVPAAPAARLLRSVVPAAAGELDGIGYASVALVTLAYPAAGMPMPQGSGFLVPAVEKRVIKAATFSSRKWAWYAGSDDLAASDVFVVRCSIGRHGEVAELQRDDEELIAAAARDLAALAGIRGVPRDSVVTRWGGGLPQYAVGHLDRVARIKAAVAAVPALAVCGAAYDGVGIPACIGSARAAASQILAGLFGSPNPARENGAP